MLTVDLTEQDPFAAAAEVRVAEASADRAVVEQPALRHLDNHVGVRHASALFTAGYEAARALVGAAVPGRSARAELVESECAYVNVGFGLITTTATPKGDGWDALATGAPAEVEVAVAGVDEAGKTVVELTHRWRVAPV